MARDLARGARFPAAGLQAGRRSGWPGSSTCASWRYMNSSWKCSRSHSSPLVAGWPAASRPSPGSGSCWAAGPSTPSTTARRARWPASRRRPAAEGDRHGVRELIEQRECRARRPAGVVVAFQDLDDPDGHLQRAHGVARAAAVARLAGQITRNQTAPRTEERMRMVGRLHHDAGVGLLAAARHGQRAVAADLLLHHQVREHVALQSARPAASAPAAP